MLMHVSVSAHACLQSRDHIFDQAYAHSPILDRHNNQCARREAKTLPLLGGNNDPAAFGHTHECNVTFHGVPCQNRNFHLNPN
jgi:hypothetical protein